MLVCCQTSTNKYEKLIAQYAQTNKSGTFTDCQFEVIEIKELPAITVMDSVKILEDKFNTNKQELLASITSLIKLSENNLAKEEKSRYKLAPVIEGYKKTINAQNQRLDSIKGTAFVNIYQNERQDKILLQPVECSYSYILLPSNPRQERTDIFYFTPDLEKIVKQKQVKK